MMWSRRGAVMPVDPHIEIARRSRRSFVVLGGGAVAGMAGLWAVNRGGTEEDIPPALRRVLGFNERVVRGTIYSNDHLVKLYPASAIGRIKVNALYGLESELDPAAWRLKVIPYGASQPSAELTMDDIRSLPRIEEIIDFK